MGLLDKGIIGRIRRNHGLEHAAIHILSHQNPSLRLVGRSDARGFWIYGNVTTEAVRMAVAQALQRLQGGESYLAIHPFCGTNLATASLLAVLMPLLTSSRAHGRQRIARAGGGLLMAFLAAPLLGYLVQKHVTTSPREDGRQILCVTRHEYRGLIAHRVEVAP
jgi:hypothetical protein